MGRKFETINPVESLLIKTSLALGDHQVLFNNCRRSNISIIDAGAHAGHVATKFSRRSPDSKIYAIEANPDNYEILCRNLSRNPNVVPIQAALVGKPEAETSFHLNSGPWTWGFSTVPLRNLDRQITVPAITLEQLQERFKLNPYLLKLDIEGGEYEVITQAPPSVLNCIKAISLEYHTAILGIKKFEELSEILSSNFNLSFGFGISRLRVPKKFLLSRAMEWNMIPILISGTRKEKTNTSVV